jgi:hypothetical protein
MSLTRLQAEFAQSVALLILKAKAMGYNVTLGEAYRTKEQAEIYAKQGKGIKNSLHCQRLAIDLMLFNKDFEYLINLEDYEELGEWWKTLGKDYCWGGDFGDADHFSITPDGGATK